MHKSLTYIIILVLLVLASCKPGSEAGEGEKWISLFNGTDLEGWDIKFSGFPLNENLHNTFRVEDGMLRVCYDEWDSIRGEFGHIFYRQPFSRYKLRLEYRIVGEQVAGGPVWAFKNSGVMLHSQSAASMLTGQDFPVSIEAQFLGGDSTVDRPTANLCTPGTHVVINDELHTPHCLNSASETFRGEEWIRIEVVVLGHEEIHHIVNGDTVLSYSKPQIGGNLPEGFPLIEGTLLESGYIALQAESHPYDFRNIELLDLSGEDE